MKKDLLKIIVCPVCKSKLDLSVTRAEKDEVITGSLLCKTCPHTYAIEDSIPVLLPPDQA